MTFGCHPSVAGTFGENEKKKLQTMLSLQGVVAVGEFGLDDKWYPTSSEESQIKVRKLHCFSIV